MTVRTPPCAHRTLAGLAALALACIAFVLASALSPSVASAATAGRATEASIDSLTFTQENVTSGSTAELHGTWSLPDAPATPAGFSIALPEALQGRSEEFPLLTPSEVAMGRCTVTSALLDCTLDASYLATHPRDLRGSFTFWVTVTSETTQPTLKQYEIAGLSLIHI